MDGGERTECGVSNRCWGEDWVVGIVTKAFRPLRAAW